MTFPRRPAPSIPLLLVLSIVVTALATPSAVAADADSSGYRLLTGTEAAEYELPTDMRLVHVWREPRSGLLFERYQQHAQFGAKVDNGQLTVVSRDGRPQLVAGAHFPDLPTGIRPALDGTRAIARVGDASPLQADVPEQVRALVVSRTQLMIEPHSGRLFYRVESGAPGLHQFHDVDAQTGALLSAWDALAHANGMGTGAKTDRKSLLGQNAGSNADDLTRRLDGGWRMQSMDGRLVTLDAKGGWDYLSGLSAINDKTKPAWGNDNDWSAPYQRPAVDAQYYSRLTDDYLRDSERFAFDLLDGCGYGAIRNVVHYDEFPRDGFGYDNAFWDGMNHYFVYGDGDAWTTGPLAGAQDVVTHEMTHAVTQCRAPLKYQGQAGALNEGFSDIIAAAAEWHFAEPVSSKCRREPEQAVCTDWWIGEDALLGAGQFGIRNLEDPALVELPRHWDERFTQSWDNGGVHMNASIPGHAFFLMVVGGRNSRCAGPTDTTADCDVLVPSIPLADAERIAFAAWGMLTFNATFCEARNATVAAADLLFPGSALHLSAADLSWAAVGRRATTCKPTGPFSISLARRSVAVAPGHAGEVGVTLVRGTAAGPITFSADGAAPASFAFSADGSLLGVEVPAAMPDGAYPFVVTASDGTHSRRATGVLVVDGQPPTGEVSLVRLGPSGSIGPGGSVPLRVTWEAFDDGSGVTGADLEASPNGGSWTDLTTGSGQGGTATFDAGASTYSFRVSASDAVGNTGTSGASGPWTIGRYQEGTASFSGGGWSATPAIQDWGLVRFSKTPGATATFSFDGTDAAWISVRGPKRGRAKVYIDGSFVTKVDLYTNTASERRIVFVASGLVDGPHTLRIVVAGTSGRPRVDVDGFVVLGQ